MITITKEHAFRAVLGGSCKIPPIGKEVKVLSQSDLIWFENLMTEKEKKALKAPLWTCSGYGDGDGYGDGSGSGSGSGYGYGDGDGYGDGYGYGSGSGSGYGYGYGYGDGYGLNVEEKLQKIEKMK